MLATLVPLIDDLSRDLPDAERYRRLLEAVRTLLPCDATALLKLEGEWLVPLAVNGLSPDTLGRRFKVTEHPRFAHLLQAQGPMRFPTHSDLPDPYDGLVQGIPQAPGLLDVHDCMGCPVRVGETLWGVLTLDSLHPEKFSAVALDDIQAFASLAAATASVVQRIARLALRVEDERHRADSYRQWVSEKSPATLIGQSAAYQLLMEDIALVGNSDLTVLVTGETGVGKELAAQALHAASPRAQRPFISVNCAALPETLVESELFGHVRGAFSGAVADRRGKFELADGGTLFLDEVGELSLTVQAKLLRVLQNGQLQRLGSDKAHAVDVRLIAATNRDLAQEVRAGRYRADFYHRLSVYPLPLPPLREREQDVLMLAGNFLEQNRARLGLGSLRLDATAQTALLRYDWPGNVRELEHLISRSALKAMAQAKRKTINSNAPSTTRSAGRLGVTITATHCDLPTLPAQPAVQAIAATTSETSTVRPLPLDTDDLRTSVEAHQRTRIEASLALHHHNWAAAARSLGLHRANLVRLATRLGVSA